GGVLATSWLDLCAQALDRGRARSPTRVARVLLLNARHEYHPLHRSFALALLVRLRHGERDYVANVDGVAAARHRGAVGPAGSEAGGEDGLPVARLHLGRRLLGLHRRPSRLARWPLGAGQARLRVHSRALRVRRQDVAVPRAALAQARRYVDDAD